MNEELIEKIKNLKNEDLDFYKKLIAFFDLIGINSEDLANLVNFLKNFPKMIQTLNNIVSDQNKINEILNSEKKQDDIKVSNPLEEFNKERATINLYGSTKR